MKTSKMIKTATKLEDVKVGQLIQTSNEMQMNASGHVVSCTQIGNLVVITAIDNAQHQFRTCQTENGYALITSLTHTSVKVITIED